MARETILITARTYPVPSAEHIEVVCTGGITDGGEWRRLIPVPLRYLDSEQQYRTFDVIEVDVKPGREGRPETRRVDLPTLRVVRHLRSWRSRWEWVKPTILPSLRSMTEHGQTIGAVSATEVSDFTARRVNPQWTPAQVEKLRQVQLFDERKPLEKLPCEFRLAWRDAEGMEHDSLILSWEVLQTYRRYRRRYREPIPVMREKWLKDLCGPRRGVVLFVGNLAARRHVYCVCGVFAPPKEVTDDATLW